MGSSASRAQPVQDPAEPPGTVPDQNWDAFKRLKHSRGAMWTDEMASVVEHNLRHNWDLGPRPDENRCRWDIRVDATYDYYYPVTVKWLSTPLPPAQAPGQKQREHHPPKSEQPPEERGQHQPQEHPEGHHGGDSTHQKGDQEWTASWAQERATGDKADARGRAGQWDGDPWHKGGSQGPRDGPGNAGSHQPADPWAAYKKPQDGPMPAQQSSWGSQQWQGERNPQDGQRAVQQPGRRAPAWEQLWWEGKSNTDMRFGDWRCGNWPACNFANFTYRDFCRQCKAPQ